MIVLCPTHRCTLYTSIIYTTYSTLIITYSSVPAVHFCPILPLPSPPTSTCPFPSQGGKGIGLWPIQPGAHFAATSWKSSVKLEPPFLSSLFHPKATIPSPHTTTLQWLSIPLLTPPKGNCPNSSTVHLPTPFHASHKSLTAHRMLYQAMRI